jgi:hypothetical protein
MPGWGKALIVLGLCAVVLAFLGIGLLVYGTYWAIASGEQVDTWRVVGPRSEAIFHAVNEDDPGVDAVIERFLVVYNRRVQELQEQGTGGPSQNARPMSGAELGQNIAVMQAMVPTQATLVHERVEGLPPTLVAAVNPASFGGMFKIAIRFLGVDPTVDARKHGAGRYYCFDGGEAIGWVGGTILVSGVCDLMPEVIDRMADDHAPGLLGDRLVEYMEANDGYDLYGAVDSGSGAMDRLLEGGGNEEGEDGGLREILAGTTLFDLSSHVLLGMDVVSEDEVRGQARVKVNGPTKAALTLLDPLLGEVQKDLEGKDMTMSVRAAAVDDAVVADYTLTGVSRRIDELVEKMLVPPDAP